MALFDALTIHEHGAGPYRISRYRLYFRPYTAHDGAMAFNQAISSERRANQLAQSFTANFPSYFNPNLATVYLREEEWNQGKTLKFHLVARALGIDHPIADVIAPDIHADWVGIHIKHASGFTVQTLKRNFTTGLDFGALGAGAGAGGGVGALVTAASFNPLVIALGAGVGVIAGGATGFILNKYHFLAGRRSWVIGTKQSFGRTNVENYDSIPDDALVLETAAVERLSGVFMRVLSSTPFLGDFDSMIREIWTKLLTNYIDKTGYELVPVRVWNEQHHGVSCFEPDPVANRTGLETFSGLSDMKRCGHTEMLPLSAVG